MNEERIVLLDPTGELAAIPDHLRWIGYAVESTSTPEGLLQAATPTAGGPNVPIALAILNGGGAAGLPLDLPHRLSEMVPLLPPEIVAIAQEQERDRAILWRDCGCCVVTIPPAGARESSPSATLLGEELQHLVRRSVEAHARLRRSLAHNEDLRKFFAMFAHDLRNPLFAISGYCELVSGHGELPEEARQDLEKVRRNIELLTSMTDAFLEMVRGSARMRVNRRETPLGFVVHEAVEMMRVRAHGRGIEIRFEPEVPGIAVEIDPPRIIEALANLLDNAIKFSPAHGKIDVGIVGEGEGVAITIDDEGPGVPAEERERIFSRYAQGASGGTGSGLGLGLSISRDIFQLHGGSVTVEGRSPRGTRFRASLPLVRTRESSAAAGARVEVRA